MPDETIKATECPGRLNDMYIEAKGMKPFWLFRDQFEGAYFPGTPGKWLCFIGSHFPNDLWALDVDKHKAAVQRLTNGLWKDGILEEQREGAKRPVGWGIGVTPGMAFQKACISAGYAKETVKT